MKWIYQVLLIGSKLNSNLMVRFFLSSSITIDLIVVEVNGFEPMASCVQGRRSPS
jgi:hypothetical protein